MRTRLGPIVAIILACWTLGGCPAGTTEYADGLGATGSADNGSGGSTIAGATTGSAGSTVGGTTGSGTTGTSGNSTDPAGAGSAGGGAEPSADLTARVLARVNEERAAEGAAPLTRNALLDAAAAEHAADMVDNMYFSHTGSDGSTVAERVSAQGYSWSTVGENIAYGPSDADGVMDLWMNSPGHRANILNGSYTEIGIALDNRGLPYWVQVFAAPQ
jgi:uncharacterized protein YkwD